MKDTILKMISEYSLITSKINISDSNLQYKYNSWIQTPILDFYFDDITINFSSYLKEKVFPIDNFFEEIVEYGGLVLDDKEYIKCKELILIELEKNSFFNYLRAKALLPVYTKELKEMLANTDLKINENIFECLFKGAEEFFESSRCW